jgi:elongation factor P
MISSNDFRPGVTIEFKDGVWQVIEAMHVKPGKGSALVKTKLKNLETSDVLQVTFRAGERVQHANIEKVEMIYIYKNGGQYVLMDLASKESLEVEPKLFGQNVDLLKEGLEGITALRHRGRIINVELPNSVDLSIRETPPGERGDTTSGGGKQAVLETGARVTVPLHVKTDDTIRIDTRTWE